MHLHDSDPAHPDPMDPAGESLADALRVSFKILKVVLFIVVVLYLFSGVQKLEQNEKALVLRLGVLQEEVRGPGGLVVTFPRPIDQVIKVPVTEKRTTEVTTQDVHLKEGEERSKVSRYGGLDPRTDGSIMTGDRGLVHAQWIVTYEIDDLRKFISTVYDAEQSAEIPLIRHAVENAAIEVIGQMAAVHVVRDRIADIQDGVKRKAQVTLNDLNTGIVIANIDAKPAWPLQTRSAFEQVTEAGNEKTKKIDEAKKHATEILNGVAGAAHADLRNKFDEYLLARATGEPKSGEARMTEIEDLILNRATGRASQIIQEARSYKKQVLEDIVADAQEYRGYLEEYKRNPHLLFQRLWVDAQEKIMTNPDVTKRYLPGQIDELRLIVGQDPEELREREKQQLQKQEQIKGDFSGMERGKTPPAAGTAKILR